MQIVADRGMDLSPALIEKYNIHLAPLFINFQGKTYQSGVDIKADEFYLMLEQTSDMPQTAMPSPGDFADLFREIATKDPEILYIHISAGLSGTWNAAKRAIEMVPEANIHMFDSKTLSCPYGWQVEAAAKAIAEGWTLSQITNYLKSIRLLTEGIYTLNDLKYLINGGRISHMKGLLATALQIKPIIKVDKNSGKYADVGKGRTMKGALRQMVNLMVNQYGEGAPMRIQLLHGHNPKGLEILKEELDQHFECHYDETLPVAPVLGAHTGPSLIGMSIGPLELFTNPVPETTLESLLQKLKLPDLKIPLLTELQK